MEARRGPGAGTARPEARPEWQPGDRGNLCRHGLKAFDWLLLHDDYPPPPPKGRGPAGALMG